MTTSEPLCPDALVCDYLESTMSHVGRVAKALEPLLFLVFWGLGLVGAGRILLVIESHLSVRIVVAVLALTFFAVGCRAARRWVLTLATGWRSFLRHGFRRRVDLLSRPGWYDRLLDLSRWRRIRRLRRLLAEACDCEPSWLRPAPRVELEPRHLDGRLRWLCWVSSHSCGRRLVLVSAAADPLAAASALIGGGRGLAGLSAHRRLRLQLAA